VLMMIQVKVLRPQEAFQEGKIVMQKDGFDIKSLMLNDPHLEISCWSCCVGTKLMQTEKPDRPQSPQSMMWQFFNAKDPELQKAVESVLLKNMLGKASGVSDSSKLLFPSGSGCALLSWLASKSSRTEIEVEVHSLESLPEGLTFINRDTSPLA
ncbi:unnamed protein product, partial [Symbiodinium sp. CCMP2592]